MTLCHEFTPDGTHYVVDWAPEGKAPSPDNADARARASMSSSSSSDEDDELTVAELRALAASSSAPRRRASAQKARQSYAEVSSEEDDGDDDFVAAPPKAKAKAKAKSKAVGGVKGGGVEKAKAKATTTATARAAGKAGKKDVAPKAESKGARGGVGPKKVAAAAEAAKLPAREVAGAADDRGGGVRPPAGKGKGRAKGSGAAGGNVVDEAHARVDGMVREVVARATGLGSLRDASEMGEPCAGVPELAPGKMFWSADGVDIVKKGAVRKGRYLISFPFLLAPIKGGTVGKISGLDTRTPTLYVDLKGGRLKFEGALVTLANKFVSLGFQKRQVVCEDVFEAALVFGKGVWIGTAKENPEERPLPMPEDLVDAAVDRGERNNVDFDYGAGTHRDINEAKDVGGEEEEDQEEEEELLPVEESQLALSQLTPVSSRPARASAKRARETITLDSSDEGDVLAEDPWADEVSDGDRAAPKAARRAKVVVSAAEDEEEEEDGDDDDDDDEGVSHEGEDEDSFDSEGDDDDSGSDFAP